MSKEEQMRVMFDEWRSSGKPRATFARERQIPINSFHYWCQRFEGKRPRSGRTRRHPAVTSSFVELSEPATTPSPRGPPRMRFEPPDGTTITVY